MSKQGFRARISMLMIAALLATCVPAGGFGSGFSVASTAYAAGEAGAARTVRETVYTASRPVQTVAQAVYTINDPPVLMPLPAYSTMRLLPIRVFAAPGSLVAVFMSINGGSTNHVASGTADLVTGEFDANVTLQADGEYSFTARAVKDASVSPDSKPVRTTVDTVPPVPITPDAWTSSAYNEVTLNWFHPEPLGSVRFHIKRNGQLVGTSENFSYTDSGLESQSALHYEIIAEDLAGNLSQPVEINAGTQHEKAVLVNVSGSGKVGNNDSLWPHISRDGSSVLFYSRSTDLVEGIGNDADGMFYIRNLTKQTTEALQPPVPVTEILGENTAVINSNGSVAAFSGVDTKYRQVFVWDGASHAVSQLTHGNGDTYVNGISDDGDLLLLSTHATNLITDSVDGNSDVLLYRRSTGEYQKINLPLVNNLVGSLVLSGDGRTVVYADLSWVVETFGFRPGYIHVYNLQSGTDSKLEGGGDFGTSRDGRFVAYVANGGIRLYETASGTSRLVKERSEGDVSEHPKVSDDGRLVSYFSSKEGSTFSFNSIRQLNTEAGETYTVGNPISSISSFDMSGTGKLAYSNDYTAVPAEFGYHTAVFAVCPNVCSSASPSEQTVERVAVQVSKLNRQQAAIGANVTVSAAAAPGAAVKAMVAYKAYHGGGTELEDRMATIPMTEDAKRPGTFAGVLQVTEGMAEITSVQVEAVDLQGRKSGAFATGALPLTVAGALRMKVTSSTSASLAGYRLVAWSDTLKSGSQLQIGTETIYELSLPVGTDYRVSLLGPDGRVHGEIAERAVRSGLIGDIELQAKFPAKESVRFLTTEGRGLENAKVTISDADSGLPVATGMTGMDGIVTLPAGNVGDSRIITAVLPEPYVQPVPRSVTLQVDGMIVIQGEIRFGTVTGVVTDEEGTPVNGADIHVSREGFPVTVRTGVDGRYRLDLPAGPVTLYASSPDSWSPKLYRLTVQEGKTVDQPMTVVGLKRGSIRPTVVYRDTDGNETTRSIPEYGLSNFTYSLFNHWNDQISTGPLTPNLSFDVVPGEQVKLCVRDQAEARNGEVCKEFKLNGQITEEIPFIFQEQASISGALETGRYNFLDAVVVELDENGRSLSAVHYSIRNDRFRFSLNQSGRYRLEIQGREATGNRKVSYVREFVVEQGQSLHLGTVGLVAMGVFQGKAGNGLEVSDRTRISSGRITLRGTFDSGSTPVTDMVLLISIPSGASYVEQSVMVNGQSVPATLSANGTMLQVPLAGTLAQSGKGSVTYQLQATESVEALEAQLSIQFMESGKQKEETVGSRLVNVSRVRLEAPASVAETTFTVHAFAPPGSSVTVLDGREAIGQGTASEAGYWTGAVTLAEAGEGNIHRLTLHVSINGKEKVSEPVWVEHDPKAPHPEDITLYQPGKQQVTAGLRSGIASFPFVFNPHNALLLGVTFDDPLRVGEVKLYVGGTTVPMSYNPLNRRFEGVKAPPSSDMGNISLSYRIKPEAFAASPATEEEIRASLPEALRKATYEVTRIENSVRPGLTVDPSMTPVATVRIRPNPDTEDQVEISYAYKPMPGYQPEALPEGAPPVYELQQQFDLATMTAHIRAIMPVDQAKPILALAGDGGRALTALGGFIQIDTSIGFDMKTATGVGGLLSAGYAGFEYRQKMQDMNAFMDQVRSAPCMSVADSRYYNDMLNEMSTRLAENLSMKYTMQLGSMALAATGIGAIGGAGLFILTTGLNMKLASDWEKQYTGLKSEFAADSEDACKKKDRKPGGGDSGDDDERTDRSTPKENKDDGQEVARPKWKYDPSGYVYEAVTSNRLEGVKATIFYRTLQGTWVVWDGTDYEETNPQTTDREGKYGWDVPEGRWKVLYEKEGYEPVYSPELVVLPPHTDVNIGMVSKLAPQVTSLAAAPGGGELRLMFSKYMDVGSVDPSKLAVHETNSGTTVPVTVEAVDSENGFAQTFRLIPVHQLTVGTNYSVDVDAEVASYAQVPMVEGTTVESGPVPDVSSLAADAVKDVRVVPGSEALAIAWTAEANVKGQKLLLDYAEKGAALGNTSLLDPSAELASISGLKAGQTYTVRLTTEDVFGRRSAGIMVEGTTAATLAPDRTPPHEPSGTAAEFREGKLHITWTDPDDRDLDGILLRLKKPGGSSFETPVWVRKGNGSYDFAGLNDQGIYEVKLSSIDVRENESAGTLVQAELKQTGGGGTGPTPGPGGGGGAPGPDPNLAVLKVENGKNEYTLFGGKAILKLEPGTVPAGTAIQVRSLPSAGVSAPGYRIVTPAISISSEVQPTKPFKLILAVSEDALGTGDSRKLALYLIDPAASNPLSYLGGAVKKGKNQMQGTLKKWGAYAGFNYEPPMFKDLEGHWSRSEVEILRSRHVVDGMTAERFDPNSPVSRAQVIKMLVEWMHSMQQEGTKVPAAVFKDVQATDWYAPFVAEASALGMIEGDGGRFRPTDAVTREEMAVLLQRIMHLKAEESQMAALGGFQDADQLASWAKQPVTSVIQAGLMQGVSPNAFDPKGKATRAQAAVMIYRLMEKQGGFETD